MFVKGVYFDCYCRLATCLGKVCILLTWSPRVPTTAGRPDPTLLASCCSVRLPLVTCKFIGVFTLFYVNLIKCLKCLEMFFACTFLIAIIVELSY